MKSSTVIELQGNINRERRKHTGPCALRSTQPTRSRHRHKSPPIGRLCAHRCSRGGARVAKAAVAVATERVRVVPAGAVILAGSAAMVLMRCTGGVRVDCYKFKEEGLVPRNSVRKKKKND